MKRKTLWLAVSCLMVAALLLAACAPAVTEEKEVVKEEVVKEEVVKEEVVKEEVAVTEGPGMARNSLGMLVEKPQYGGTITIHSSREVPNWSNYRSDTPYGSYGLMYEAPVVWDWTRGPAGTGDWDGTFMDWPPFEQLSNNIIESWEVTSPTSLLVKVRKGIHFSKNSVAPGREMTAHDLANSAKSTWDRVGGVGYSPTTHFAGGKASIGIKVVDDWTITLESQPGMLGSVWERFMAHSKGNTFPKELHDWDVVLAGGKQTYDMDDWRNAGGTAKFDLVGYVAGSALTFKKNPDYWGYDPLFPENKLPYADSVKVLIMTDLSTRLSALRTGRLDLVGGPSFHPEHEDPLEWDDAADLRRTHPYLKSFDKAKDDTAMIPLRQDNPALPTYKKEVRQALQMAINSQEIIDDYYGGNANLIGWPINPQKPQDRIFWKPLDQYAEIVQKMYGYYPDEARQMLADAGYPNGFKLEIATMADGVDLLSIVSEYWKAIGVEMEIKVYERTAYKAVTGAPYNYKDGFFQYWRPLLVKSNYIRAGNAMGFPDPHGEEVFEANMAAYFKGWEKGNYNEAWPARVAILKPAVAYQLEQAWAMQLPNYRITSFWQPWLHNWYGGMNTSYYDGSTAMSYMWVDQALKDQYLGK